MHLQAVNKLNKSALSEDFQESLDVFPLTFKLQKFELQIENMPDEKTSI